MKMKEVILKTGLPENTIRFYESRGLVETTTERRNGRTYHEFSEEAVQALRQVVILRKAGFSIEEILKLQRHPGDISEVVENYQKRIREEHETVQRLSRESELKTAENWNELTRRVERAMTRIQDYESPLRFGQNDPESEEQKQAAIAAYRKKSKFRDHILLYTTIGLGVLCLALLIALILLVKKEVDTVPAPSGSTEDWIYYQSDHELLRCQKDGTGEEIIYESGSGNNNSFRYILDEEKIYILDDGSLYSINADGSHMYEYPAQIGSSYLSSGSAEGWSDIFLLCGGNIYAKQSKGGSFGGETFFVRVPLDGSEQVEVKLDISVCYAAGWNDKLYLFGGSDEEGEMILIWDPETGKVLEEVPGPFSYIGDSSEARYEALYFTDTEAYVGLFYQNSGEGKLIRVTPDNLDGEIVGGCPGYIRYVRDGYVVYRKTNGAELLKEWYVENMETGNTESIAVGSFEVVNFTPLGLKIGDGGFVEYP